MFICTWSVSLSDLLFWLSKAILVSDNCRNESLQAACQKRQKQIHSGNKCWEFSLMGINVRYPVVKGLITFDHSGGRLLLADCITPAPPLPIWEGNTVFSEGNCIQQGQAFPSIIDRNVKQIAFDTQDEAYYWRLLHNKRYNYSSNWK